MDLRSSIAEPLRCAPADRVIRSGGPLGNTHATLDTYWGFTPPERTNDSDHDSCPVD